MPSLVTDYSPLSNSKMNVSLCRAWGPSVSFDNMESCSTRSQNLFFPKGFMETKRFSQCPTTVPEEWWCGVEGVRKRNIFKNCSLCREALLGHNRGCSSPVYVARCFHYLLSPLSVPLLPALRIKESADLWRTAYKQFLRGLRHLVWLSHTAVHNVGADAIYYFPSLCMKQYQDHGRSASHF